MHVLTLSSTANEMSTTWGLLCFFQTTVLLTVTCTSDAAHSPLIRTLESEGDFSDCIDSDQLTNGVFSETLCAPRLLCAEPRSFRILDLFSKWSASTAEYF